jgi:hypothetical protein
MACDYYAGNDRAKIHLPSGRLLYIVAVRKLIDIL